MLELHKKTLYSIYNTSMKILLSQKSKYNEGKTIILFSLLVRISDSVIFSKIVSKENKTHPC